MGSVKSMGWNYDEAQEGPEGVWPGGGYPPRPAGPPGMYASSAMPSGTYVQRDGGGGGYYSQPAAGLGPPLAPSPCYGGQPEAGAWPQPRQVGPPGAPPPGHESLIIWDWDDTLMCSSAINANQLMPHQAQQLETLLEQALNLSMKLGETIIVTNADELWVIESTRRFCPRVMPLLSRMSVISARRKYEAQFPRDVFAWKRETFREVVAERRSRSLSGLNLVVLGDSPAEMEAAQTSTVGLGVPVAIKTVKFKETPSCEELLEQLRVVCQELAAINSDEKSSCRNLVQWMRPSIPGLQGAGLPPGASPAQWAGQWAANPAAASYPAPPMAQAPPVYAQAMPQAMQGLSTQTRLQTQVPTYSAPGTVQPGGYAYGAPVMPSPYTVQQGTYLGGNAHMAPGPPMIYAVSH